MSNLEFSRDMLLKGLGILDRSERRVKLGVGGRKERKEGGKEESELSSFGEVGDREPEEGRGGRLVLFLLEICTERRGLAGSGG